MRAGDLLPASLQQLDIGEINSVQRLVGQRCASALHSCNSYCCVCVLLPFPYVFHICNPVFVITAKASARVFLFSLPFMRAGDLLPASLQQLDIGDINSVQRLVGLTALRRGFALLRQLLLHVCYVSVPSLPYAPHPQVHGLSLLPRQPPK
jgi:hypothetical protein